MARIDPRDYQTALDQARANVVAAQASIDTLNQQIAQQKLVVEQDRQQVASDQAALVYSQQNYQRYTQLAKDGWGTVQQCAASASRHSRKSGWHCSVTRGCTLPGKSRSRFSRRQLAQAKATLAQQQAIEHQAELNLELHDDHGAVRRHGRRAHGAGRASMSGGHAADGGGAAAAVYVTANYKETQLTDVRPGQPVTIDVDTFPGSRCTAMSTALRRRAAQEFALLPPDNATGNFTKIVQRIPVKIVGRQERSARSARCGRACRSSRRSTPSRTDAPMVQLLLRRRGRHERRSRSARLAEDLDRRRRRIARRLHGGPEHPDHQRLAAVYRGRHRHRRRLRHLGLHRLSDRRDHRHSADRFHEPRVFAAPLSARQHGAVPAVLGAVRAGAQPERDDRVAARCKASPAAS